MSAYRLRYRALTLTLLFILLGMGTRSGAQGSQSSRAGLTFSDLYMVDPKNGWAVVHVESDDPKNDFGQYAVLGTHDGGKTWSLAPLPSSPVTPDGESPYLFTLDTQHVWALIDFQLWRTIDGGQTWDLASTVNAHQTLLTFVDPMHGWLLSRACCAAGNEPAYLLRTTDGGNSWERVSATEGFGTTLGGLPSRYHTGLVFEDPLNGWMTNSAISGNGFLIHTTDGGRTWENVDVPDVPADMQCDFVSPQHFRPNTFAFLVICGDGTTQTSYIYQTHNSGKAWQVTAVGEPHPYMVAMVNSSVFWAASKTEGENPTYQLYQTLDGGKTWALLTPTYLDRLRVYFYDQSSGWSVVEGKLLSTTDGGRTWTPIEAQLPELPLSLRPLPRFQQVHMVTAQDGWAWAIDRASVRDSTERLVIVTTHDGGKTWNNATPPVLKDQELPWLEAPNFALIDSNRVRFYFEKTMWRTEDGGRTWASSTIDLDDWVGFFFADSMHGWLASGCCTIYRTGDGGVSWQKAGELTNTANTYLVDIAFEDLSDGWLAVASDKMSALFHTHDGGQTWNAVDLPIGKSRIDCRLGRMVVPRAKTIRVFQSCYGNPGATTVFRSNDDGQTWQTTVLRGAMRDAGMFTASDGWLIETDPADSFNRLLLRTTDGGQSWQRVGLLPNSLREYSTRESVTFDFLNPRLAWATDIGGRVEYTADGGKTWTLTNAPIAP